MHFSEWPGFVVKIVAMTFQIVKKTVAEPVLLVSRIMWNTGFYNFGSRRSGSYFAPGQMYLAIES